MTASDKEIVSVLRARLADRVGQDRYEVWFGPQTRLTIHGETLTVVVPNQFFQDWLRTNFRKDLEASCLEAAGQPLSLEFRVHPPGAPSGPRPISPKSARQASAATEPPQAEAPVTGLPVLVEPPQAIAAASSSHAAPNGHARSGHTSNDDAPAVAGSTPFARRKFSCLSTFIVGDSNCLAHRSAQMAAERPGSLSPLFVHGATGVGKTHLLEGIWSTFRRAHRSATAIYLSSEQFTHYFLEALRGSGLPSFRRKYRDVELLLIDDVQFFSGKRATLGELLHTIDTLLRQGRQVVMAADRSPAALTALGPELTARLAGGMTCRIDAPDYNTRLGIVRQSAAETGMEVPAEVQAYIASHFSSHARQLLGALKRLHAVGLAHNRPITLALAEESLSDLMHAGATAVRLTDIDKAVRDEFGLERESLQSDRKGKVVCYPRMLAMFLARKHTRAALSEIGHYFGRRSHSTVIAAQKKVESWMAKGSPVQLADRSLQLEEVIRRVEQRLLAS